MKPQNKKASGDGFILREDGSMLTPEFRVSFPYVLEKDKNGKYGVAMIFDKADTDMEILETAVAAAIVEKWGLKRPKSLLLPILDGDDTDRDEYQGKFYINGKCGKYKPGLINSEKQPIEDPEEFYPGCWARAVITLYSWDNPTVGKKGVSVNVRSLMKIRDDEPLIGRVKAEDDFDGVASAADDV
jgi:hypothetical protein